MNLTALPLDARIHARPGRSLPGDYERFLEIRRYYDSRFRRRQPFVAHAKARSCKGRALVKSTCRNGGCACRAQQGFSKRRLLAVPNLAPHFALFPSDFSSSFASLLNAHQTCAPVIVCSSLESLQPIRQRGRKDSNPDENDQGCPSTSTASHQSA